MSVMCRNIRRLHNYAPPVTDAEIHDAALQFVRKVSGFARPSQVNAAAFDEAVARRRRGDPAARGPPGDLRPPAVPRGGRPPGPGAAAGPRAVPAAGGLTAGERAQRPSVTVATTTNSAA